jgi:heptosyltransferase I
LKLRGNKYLKGLDKYFGIPLLFTLGLLRKNRKLPCDISSVAIMMAPAIGDIILSSGLLKDIKSNSNNILIHLFVPEGYSDVASLIGNYDQLTKINLSKPLKSLAAIRRYSFDVFIDASQWARLPALITFFSKSKYTIGFLSKGQGKHFVFDKAVHHSNETHEFYNLKNLNFFKVDSNKYLPTLDTTNLVQVDKKKVTIHLKPSGYISERKEWPIEYWKIVIDYMLKKELTIVFTGSSADKPEIDSIIKNFNNTNKLKNLAGSLTIIETANELRSSSIVISVNTGIMHLASFLNCNLIALHGPTNSKRWGPLNKNCIIINSPYLEAPCLNLGFEYNCKDNNGKCMKAILPDVVIKSIESFLN